MASRHEQLRKRRAIRNGAWVNEYKSEHGCVDCGSKGLPPYCYDFDHLDGSTKLDNVSSLVAAARNRRAITNEIAKCELVCANCHRIRTMDRKAWLRAAPPDDNQTTLDL